jgi:hypothetical protein
MKLFMPQICAKKLSIDAVEDIAGLPVADLIAQEQAESVRAQKCLYR